MHFDDYPSESKSSDFLCILVNVLFLLYFLIEVTIFVPKYAINVVGLVAFTFVMILLIALRKAYLETFV